MGSVTAVDKDKLKTGMIKVILVRFSMDIEERYLFNF
jgi:hypothetical protein